MLERLLFFIHYILDTPFHFVSNLFLSVSICATFSVALLNFSLGGALVLQVFDLLLHLVHLLLGKPLLLLLSNVSNLVRLLLNCFLLILFLLV